MKLSNRVVITGGAGFLGLHLARYFSEKKFIPIILDIADFPANEYPKNSKYIRCDIRDKSNIRKNIGQGDIVVHAAAALPLRPKEEIMETNVEGTKNVLNASLKNKAFRVIYISSTAVYGIPRKHPVYEDDPMSGVGAYGVSKIEAESACQVYRKKGLGVCVIRPKTFVGTHRLGVFEILFDWIKDNKKIPVVGSGLNKYQLLEVDDLVHAIYLAATHHSSLEVNTEFNVGAQEYQNVLTDLNEVFRQVGSGSRVLPTPAWPTKTALRIFESLGISPLYKWVYETADRDSFVSIDKIKKTLSWKPKFSNVQSLVKAYKWYQRNYKEIKSRGEGTTHTVSWKQGILGVFKKFL